VEECKTDTYTIIIITVWSLQAVQPLPVLYYKATKQYIISSVCAIAIVPCMDFHQIWHGC